MSRLTHFCSYALIRTLTFPLGFLPSQITHSVGKHLGNLMFYLLPKFRKRALSNLTLASELGLSAKDAKKVAKEAFHNLVITCLEYSKLDRIKNIQQIAICENPEVADKIIKSGQGVIFFCGHQANWEILFLEGTSRMPGVAIGRPIANKYLYNWVVNIRQKFGGKIIEPKSAVKEGLRGLRKGAFLGIVGDQGMPESGFATDFLGRKAFTSTIPALLAYRTGAPLFVATIRRENGKYFIRYSDPLYADQNKEMHEEVPQLMTKTLALFEKSICKHPGQWLWQHNRWKLQQAGTVKRSYRYDALCVAMPEETSLFEKIWTHVALIREIYPEEHITLLLPHTEKQRVLPFHATVRYYESLKDLFVTDYGPKLLFNFTDCLDLTKHYEKLSVMKTVTMKDFPQDFKTVLLHAR